MDIYTVINEAEKTLNKVNSKKHKLPKAEQDWIYLIHHIHPPEKEEDMETLHHCFLFSAKKLRGTRFEQKHKKDGKILLHVLVIDDPEKAPEVVYDHLNNGFKIKIMEVDGTKYAVINGLVSVKKTKWSLQDKGKLYDSISQ